MKRYQLTTWQPRRKKFAWLPPEEGPGTLRSRHPHPFTDIPPHDDSRWPPWWCDTRRCMWGFTMYRCSWCGYGTRRRGKEAPGHCIHCGYSVKRAIEGTAARVRKIPRATVFRSRADLVRPDPDRKVWTPPPFGVVNSRDPWEDELPGEQSW